MCLDGAILLISAKDGIRLYLFDAIRKRKLPALIFINKIDQPDIDLDSLYEDIRAKLSSHILSCRALQMESLFCPKTLNPLSEEFKRHDY